MCTEVEITVRQKTKIYPNSLVLIVLSTSNRLPFTGNLSKENNFCFKKQPTICGKAYSQFQLHHI